MLQLSCQLLSLAALALATPHPRCKAIPGTATWPSDPEWAKLNTTLSGRLLKPAPPGAVCHPTQATFDPLTCPSVQAGWLTSAWHTDQPTSTVENNWSNDTCLPDPTVPCSGEGYSIYVVNATSAQDVKIGVEFAREKNVRLVVRGTGHDYLGRSTAPNSLLIWTHHIRGVDFHDGFKPKGCSKTIDTKAVTVAAGMQMLELDEQAHLRNLTIVGGGAGTVGIGGYITGGGHSAISSTYGLATDQVLEMEIMTPGGDILTINECQNRDLFWAMRGGGGSTFGVLTSVTIKAFPSTPFHVATVFLYTAPGSASYFDVASKLISHYPGFDDQGISAYSYLGPSLVYPQWNVTSPLDVFVGSFFLPEFHPSNTSTSLEVIINRAIGDATSAYAGQYGGTTAVMKSYPDFYAYYAENNGPLDGGHDELLGSRLIGREALTGNLTALRETLSIATPSGGISEVFLVAGKGVRDAKPRGGENSVNPAWRKAYVHTIVGVRWNAFDTAEEVRQTSLLNDVYVEALRKLEPNSGCYVNESHPDEPDFQNAFWGANYERLLAIKKKVDPQDVLWCHPCVGNEGWEVNDGILCRK